MYAKIFVALISFLCLESVQPASIGSIAQNIHSDLILLDANLGSSLRTNRDGRRINLDRFAVPSGKQYTILKITIFEKVKCIHTFELLN